MRGTKTVTSKANEKEYKEKKIFISHCTTDVKICEAIKETKDEIFGDESDVIFTYGEGGIPAGEKREEYIRKELRESDCMIVIMTDAYLRSSLCLVELSVFWYEQKPIFLIAYNGKEGRDYFEKLVGASIICVDGTRSDAPKTLVTELTKKDGMFCIPKERAELAKAWMEVGQDNPDGESKAPKGSKKNKTYPGRAYIGAEKKYESWMRFCNLNGVERMVTGTADPKHMKENLSGKDEIYVVGTTNKGFVDANIRFLSEQLATGTDIFVMCGDATSDFMYDVASVELHPQKGETIEDWMERVKVDEARLRSEINGVRANLQRVRKDAEEISRETDTKMGELYIGNAFTLIRQTMIVGVDKSEHKLWCWFNTTMPPLRASETLGMEVIGDYEASASIASQVFKHVEELKKVADYRGNLYNITRGEGHKIIGEITDPDRRKWSTSIDKAIQFREERQNNGVKKALIEVAAQHPLKNGKTPGRAFAERLDMGVDLYERLVERGYEVKIYVPGSLHLGDQVALCDAGKKYLTGKKHIKASDIFADDMNKKYKGEAGTYNSADECYVTAQIFKDGDYSELFVVCSANQIARKKLFYYSNGVAPKIYSVPDDDFHNDMREFFDAIPNILYVDNDWQRPDSEFFIRSRLERMEGYVDPRQKQSNRDSWSPQTRKKIANHGNEE